MFRTFATFSLHRSQSAKTNRNFNRIKFCILFIQERSFWRRLSIAILLWFPSHTHKCALSLSISLSLMISSWMNLQLYPPKWKLCPWKKKHQLKKENIWHRRYDACKFGSTLYLLMVDCFCFFFFFVCMSQTMLSTIFPLNKHSKNVKNKTTESEVNAWGWARILYPKHIYSSVCFL